MGVVGTSVHQILYSSRAPSFHVCSPRHHATSDCPSWPRSLWSWFPAACCLAVFSKEAHGNSNPQAIPCRDSSFPESFILEGSYSVIPLSSTGGAVVEAAGLESSFLSKFLICLSRCQRTLSFSVSVMELCSMALAVLNRFLCFFQYVANPVFWLNPVNFSWIMSVPRLSFSFLQAYVVHFLCLPLIFGTPFLF